MKQYIILDTNIWVYKTRLLSDSISAALLFHLNNTDGKIIIPEVVEKEVNSNLIKIANESRKTIQKQYKILQRLYGFIDDYRLPSEGTEEQLFAKKIKELGSLVIKLPFKFQHAKGALRRVIEGIPPNSPSSPNKSGNQQFKDSCIWEAAREVTEKGDVVLITNDYAFFEGKKPEKGIAKELKNELDELSNTISVFPSIDTFLEDIKDSVAKLNPAMIRRILHEHMKENQTIIDAIGEKQLGQINSISFKAFLTERNNILAIQYKLGYLIDDIEEVMTEESLGEGSMIVKGNCLFDYVNNDLTENLIDEISYEDGSGKPLPGRGTTMFSRISATIGREIKRHQFRSKIPAEML